MGNMVWENKRNSKIEQNLAWHFKYNGAGPPPFLCSKKITPFSNSMVSANKETGLQLMSTVESVYP